MVAIRTSLGSTKYERRSTNWTDHRATSYFQLRTSYFASLFLQQRRDDEDEDGQDGHDGDRDGGGLAKALALEPEVGQHRQDHRRVGRPALRHDPDILETVRRPDRGEQRDDDDHMADARQGDEAEALPGARAVHLRRLVLLLRNVLQRGQ